MKYIVCHHSSKVFFFFFESECSSLFSQDCYLVMENRKDEHSMVPKLCNMKITKYENNKPKNLGLHILRHEPCYHV